MPIPSQSHPSILTRFQARAAIPLSHLLQQKQQKMPSLISAPEGPARALANCAKSLTALRSSHEPVNCCAGKRLLELIVRGDQVPRSARRTGHRNSSTMVHLLLFWGNGMGTPDPGERERRSKSWRKQWFSGDGIHCFCCE